MEQAESFTFSGLMRMAAEATGAGVSFHDEAGLTAQIPALRLGAEQHYHHLPYCQFAKQNGNAPACVKNKNRSVEIARGRGNSFEGQCPFGVWELAQPVRLRGELLGVLYLGGFSGSKPLALMNEKRFSGPWMPRISEEKKAELRRSAAALAELMSLLADRHLRSGKKIAKKKPAEFYLKAMNEWIAAHFHEDLGLEDFASSLGMNPGYLGETLLEETGKSFRERLLEYRLEKAKVFLIAEDPKRVTQIARDCGFSDSNYFSVVFKKSTGLTPRAFAKKHLFGKPKIR